MSQVISIRISDEIAYALKKISDETERAKAFHVKKALETYINEFADMQVALDRLHNIGDEIISNKDMRKKLGL